MFLPNELSAAQSKNRSVPFNFNPHWFSWTFLMVHSKAKMKSNVHKHHWLYYQFNLIHFKYQFFQKTVMKLWAGGEGDIQIQIFMPLNVSDSGWNLCNAWELFQVLMWTSDHVLHVLRTTMWSLINNIMYIRPSYSTDIQLT